MMKNRSIVTGLLAVLLISCVLCGKSAMASGTEDFEKARTPALWIEGQLLGDMVLGARAQLIFGYIDSKAYSAIKSHGGSLPLWMNWNMQYFHKARSKKRSFFILRYKAIKNWNFSPEDIVIGGYKVTEKDIYTRSDYRNTGELPPDTLGTLAVSIPNKYVKPGKTILLSYKDDSMEWTIPKR